MPLQLLCDCLSEGTTVHISKKNTPRGSHVAQIKDPSLTLQQLRSRYDMSWSLAQKKKKKKKKTLQDVLKRGFRHLCITVTWQNQQQQWSHISVGKEARRKDFGQGRLASICKSPRFFSHSLSQTALMPTTTMKCCRPLMGKHMKGLSVLPCSVIRISKSISKY